jgi:hypothetical protein
MNDGALRAVKKLYIRLCAARDISGVFSVALGGKSMIEMRQALAWEAIVEDYSGRELLIPEGRLPAIAGIASELEKLWEEIYLAGLWRKYLVKYLAWERVRIS